MSDNNDQRPAGPAVPPQPTYFPSGDAAQHNAQRHPASPQQPPMPQQSPYTATGPTTPLPKGMLAAMQADSQATTPLGSGWPNAAAGAQQNSQQNPQSHAQPPVTHGGQSFGPAASLPPGAPVPLSYQQHNGTPDSRVAGATPKAPKTRKRGGVTAGILAAALVVGVGGGFGGAWLQDAFAPNEARPVSGGEGGTITVNNPGSVTQTTAIAAQALPSVVTISVSTDQTGGSGSGVILNDEGYVLTNTHVVTLDGATGVADVSVTLADGRIYEAELVGTDPTYDLAVIKLKDATDLTPITWGDSSALNVGDVTVALGAPLGLANTVTEGIVSNLNRSIEVASAAAPDSGESSGEDEDPNGQGGPFTFDVPGQDTTTTPSDFISIAVIQTDAAINPGNSGGALVNAKGELIGINVAIATAGGSSGQAGSIGVGFSIPSHIAQRISEEIIADGSATHGLLGANVLPAASMKGATQAGAYISGVTDKGAAEEAGLQKGDVVTQLGDAPINNATDLTAQVRALAGNAKTTITYLRDGESFEADVTLGTL